MTIKKTVAKEGGAAIADRFRLDAPAPKAKPVAASGVSVKAALGAAGVAILVAGVLAYTLWKHWEFLMPA